MPNVIISSHYSGLSPHIAERSIRIFVDNLARYLARRPLANVVDLNAGY